MSDVVLLVVLESERRGARALRGVTRLQKLLYLVSTSPEYAELQRTGDVPEIQFEPYRMGPFTPEIYDVIEFLSNFEPSLITAVRGTRDRTNDIELSRYLDGVDLDESEPGVDSDLVPTTFALTPDGRRVAEYLDSQAPRSLIKAIRQIVHDYGSLSLTELLRRVYRDHPDMTTRSEILGQVGLQPTCSPAP